MPDCKVLEISSAASHRLAQKSRWIVLSGRARPPLRNSSSSFPVTDVLSGNRIALAGILSLCKRSTNALTCVDLPLRSIPSISMKAPRGVRAVTDGRLIDNCTKGGNNYCGERIHVPPKITIYICAFKTVHATMGNTFYSRLRIKCLHNIATKEASCLVKRMFRTIICRLSELSSLSKMGDSVISSAAVRKISDKSGADALGSIPRITVLSKKFLNLGATDGQFSSPIVSKFSPLFRKPLEHISLKNSLASSLQGKNTPTWGNKNLKACISQLGDRP